MQEEFLRDSEKETTAVISEAAQETETRDDVMTDKEVKNVKETGKKEGAKISFLKYLKTYNRCHEYFEAQQSLLLVSSSLLQ